MAAEQKYNWGGGMRCCEAADYPCKASPCEGQKLGAKAPLVPPGSAALGSLITKLLFSMAFARLLKTYTCKEVEWNENYTSRYGFPNVTVPFLYKKRLKQK